MKLTMTSTTNPRAIESLLRKKLGVTLGAMVKSSLVSDDAMHSVNKLKYRSIVAQINEGTKSNDEENKTQHTTNVVQQQKPTTVDNVKTSNVKKKCSATKFL